MINVTNYRTDKLHEVLKKKHVHCIGAGRNLDRFLREFKEVVPRTILDNFAEGYRNLNGTNIPVSTVESLRESNLSVNRDIIVVTTKYYHDILDQLDSIKECDGLECVVPFAEDVMEIRRNERVSADKTDEIGSKFQILFDDGNDIEPTNAGEKAPSDIISVADVLGYKKISVKSHWEQLDDLDWRTNERGESWERIKEAAENSSIMLLQNPNWNENEFEVRKKYIKYLKSEKDVRIISVIHDIENLRKIYNTEYMQREAEFMLKTSDILIVHNKKMAEYYQQEGIESERLINLKIFDYLCSDDSIPLRGISRNVVVAGNLSADKNPHIALLSELGGIKFHLYGMGYEKQKDEDNITYHGTFSADELPDVMIDGFGLVWGGDSLDGCTGNAGEYLRYNAPHKLSLYLAAGLPVIIWDKAAMADFVLENEVGFTVSSLYELEENLNNITEEKYTQYLSNANRIGLQLRNGEYTKKAIKEAEQRLERRDK